MNVKRATNRFDQPGTELLLVKVAPCLFYFRSNEDPDVPIDEVACLEVCDRYPPG